jgi:hypothetical protein
VVRDNIKNPSDMVMQQSEEEAHRTMTSIEKNVLNQIRKLLAKAIIEAKRAYLFDIILFFTSDFKRYLNEPIRKYNCYLG